MMNQELLNSLQNKTARIAYDIELIKEIDNRFQLHIMDVAPIDQRYVIVNFKIEDYLDVLEFDVFKSGKTNVVVSVWCHLPFKSIPGYEKIKFRLMDKNISKIVIGVNSKSAVWNAGDDHNSIALLQHLMNDTKFSALAANKILRMMNDNNCMKISEGFPIAIREKITKMINFS